MNSGGIEFLPILFVRSVQRIHPNKTTKRLMKGMQRKKYGKCNTLTSKQNIRYQVKNVVRPELYRMQLRIFFSNIFSVILGEFSLKYLTTKGKTNAKKKKIFVLLAKRKRKIVLIFNVILTKIKFQLVHTNQ